MSIDFTPYTNHFLLPGFTEKHQEKLSSAHVAIIGAGGLGVPVLQYLLAMGVGKLTIIDGDKVMLKNLNRQVIYRPSDEGMRKTEVIRELYTSEVQSGRLQPVTTFLNDDNIAKLLETVQYVVDATDNYHTRYLLDDFCSQKNIPWVYAAIHQFEAQVSVFNATRGDAGIRYRDVYPSNNLNEAFSCQSEGVIGSVTGIIGSIQANEVFKLVTGYEPGLHGYLLYINLKTYQVRKIRINKRTDTPQPSIPEQSTLPPIEISLTEFNTTYPEPGVIIDLRSQYLFSKSKIDGAIQLEAAKIPALLKHVDAKKGVLVYCEKGFLSRQLVKELRSLSGRDSIFSLNGGYSI